MTRMTGPDCVVMCNLINTYIHTYTVTYDTACKKITNTKPKFELSIDRSIGIRQHSLPARGKSARYSREFSFARYHDAVVAIMLHSSAAANTSRTGRSTSPAA